MSENQFTEEEAGNWVEQCLAQPDPPNFTAEPYNLEGSEQIAQPDSAMQASWFAFLRIPHCIELLMRFISDHLQA